MALVVSAAAFSLSGRQLESCTSTCRRRAASRIPSTSRLLTARPSSRLCAQSTLFFSPRGGLLPLQSDRFWNRLESEFLAAASPLGWTATPLLACRAIRMASRPRTRTGQGRAGMQGSARSSLVTKDEEEEQIVRAAEGRGGGGEGGPRDGGGGGGGGGGRGGGEVISWLSSGLVFAFWAGLLTYAFTSAPNQTSYRDMYFIEKLINLHGDDGFDMNKVLVAEFYIMGCWPLVYSSLLIPTGRSRKGGVKIGPFAVASFFVGAFALLPYFGLWRPPPPAVAKDELRRFPLKVLESKLTAVGAVVAGIALAGYAGLAGVDQWAEFAQYFRESRFIHVMSIDFVTLCLLAPFWVYNDLSVRQGSDTVSWWLLVSAIPYFGPALYLVFRPPLSAEGDES